MGLLNWFKTTTLYGKLIRDAGKIKVQRDFGSTSLRLQELRASLHTGERQYLLTISETVFLSYSVRYLKLSYQQLQEIQALCNAGLAEERQPVAGPAIAPGGF